MHDKRLQSRQPKHKGTHIIVFKSTNVTDLIKSVL